MVRSVFAMFVILLYGTLVLANAKITVVDDRAYTLPQTRELVVRSPSLGRNFVVLVSMPGGPFVQADAKHPAVYVLDGGFGIAGPIGQTMSWSGAITPAYIVSVNYPSGDAHRTHDLLHHLRTRDDGTTEGGGGAAFATFLTHELRPLLESRFPLDPQRSILFGHSLAGLFTAKVMVSTPDAFSGYVIASPSTGADPGIVDAVAKVAARGRGRRVFIAAGQHESAIVRGAEQLAAALSGPNSTFDIEKVIYTDATHVSYWPDLVPAAYRHVLPAANKPATKRVAVTLNDADRARIAGTYAIANGRTLIVTLRGPRIFAIMAGTPETEIIAESPQQFFAPAQGFDVTFMFEGPTNVPAQAVVVSLNGAKTRAVRTRQ